MSELPSSNKCRIISFRVSENEYHEVERLSRKLGYNSVSQFIRDGMLRAESEPTRTAADAEINRLWRRLEALTSSLESIHRSLRASTPKS